MRKRTRIVWAACGAALLALALAGAMAGRAAAQSGDRTPWLGVTTQELTGELREGLGYEGSGVLVNRVVPDGPAATAGIRKGDVIVSFNSRTIDSPDELVRQVRSARVGQTVAVAIVRDGARRTVSARLGERPAEEDVLRAPEAPEAPRAPRAPQADRRFRVEVDGKELELPDDGPVMVRSMGRGRLGVRVEDLNAGLADALGLTDGRGALVLEVLKDTPAERAGLKAGDVVTQVGDRAVADASDLTRALRDEEGKVSLTVLRKGQRRTVQAELGPRSQAMRVRRGDGPMTLRVPEVRGRVLRDLERYRLREDRGDLERELRELREELRELRRRLEAMERD